MALREYTDPDGTKWQVYDVIPQSAARALTPDIKEGWLVFECDTRKVRVVPTPDDWESCSEEQLRLYLRSGTPAPKTTLNDRQHHA
jgi:hypothetical protein